MAKSVKSNGAEMKAEIKVPIYRFVLEVFVDKGPSLARIHRVLELEESAVQRVLDTLFKNGVVERIGNKTVIFPPHRISSVELERFEQVN